MEANDNVMSSCKLEQRLISQIYRYHSKHLKKTVLATTDLCIILKDLYSFCEINRKIRELKIVRGVSGTFSRTLLFNPRHFGFILNTPRHDEAWNLHTT